MNHTITSEDTVIDQPNAMPIIPATKKDNKKKPNFEECKILSYNAYTGNLAFVYKGSNVQITVQEGIKLKDTVNVKYVDGKYNIVD